MPQAMLQTAVEIVLAWHRALNAGDVERLLALTAEDVEVAGPRGTGRGSQLVREWVTRAGIRLTPGRRFQRGATVVVEGRAEWRTPATGEVTGEVTAGQDVATHFEVREGRVARIARYAELAEALRAAGLAAGDLAAGDTGGEPAR